MHIEIHFSKIRFSRIEKKNRQKLMTSFFSARKKKTKGSLLTLAMSFVNTRVSIGLFQITNFTLEYLFAIKNQMTH